MTSIPYLSLFRPCCVLTLSVAGAIVYPSSSLAAQWQLGSGIETALSHTRTVDTAVGETTDSEVVWSIRPYLSLSGRGRSLDVNARLGIDHTSNIDTGSTTTRPAASINGELTVIDRRAWVTVDTNVARSSESTNGSAEDFIGNLDSDSTQIDFSLSERGFLPLGSTSQVNGAHRFSTSDVSGDGDRTSQTHSLSFDTVSYLRNARSFVITDLYYQHTDIGDAGTFEAGEVAAGIGIPVRDASTQVMLLIGQEWYDLMLVEQELDGFFWAVGVNWQPVKAFQLQAGYGERGYGRTPSIRASLVGRRNTLSLEWSRQSAFQRNFQLGVRFPDATTTNDATDVGTTGSEEISEPDVLGQQSSLSPFIDDVQSIDEVIRLDHVFRGRVSTLSTGIGFSKRSSISDSDSSESTLSFATLGLTRAIGQSVSASAVFRLAESKTKAEAGKQRISRVRLALTWSF